MPILNLFFPRILVACRNPHEAQKKGWCPCPFSRELGIFGKPLAFLISPGNFNRTPKLRTSAVDQFCWSSAIRQDSKTICKQSQMCMLMGQLLRTARISSLPKCSSHHPILSQPQQENKTDHCLTLQTEQEGVRKKAYLNSLSTY